MDKRTVRAIGTVVVAFAVAGLVARFVFHEDRRTSVASPPSPKYEPIEGVRGVRGLSSGADFALAVGDDGMILRHERASGWAPEASPTHAALHAVAQQLDEAIAVGETGTIAEYTGGAWRLSPSPSTHMLRAVAYSAYGAIAVGDGGTIVRRAAPGEPWTLDPAPATSDLFGVCAGLRDVWAVGGVILRRSLTGWQVDGFSPRATLRAAFCDDHAALAVGDSGVMLERLEDAPWQDMPSPTKEALLAISAPVGTRSWLVVGAHGVTLRASTVESSGVGWDLRAVTEGPFGTFIGGEGGLLRRR